MYSRKKGTSGSTRPLRKTKAAWVTYSQREVELLIAKLAKEGMLASQIGMVLRDSYGIPDVRKFTAGNTISAVLKDNKLAPDMPDDVLALIKKVILINKHREFNKKDQTAKRGLELTQSKIRRLTKYYKRTGKLSQDWKYDPEKIRLMIE